MTPSRVLGQPSVDYRSSNPNVVEGREFFSPWGVAVDRSTNPPPLYVVDFGNNRVLGWRDARNFSSGSQADIVIGQLDFRSTLQLGPGTSRTTGLNAPGAVAVDSSGNLYVADLANNRILRFPRPFSQPTDLILPDMVIGQASYTTRDANSGGISERSIALASGNTVARTGLAFDAQGNLWFSDALNNRVLRYPASALTSGRNQPAADLVLGQQTFTTATAPPNNTASRSNRSVLLNPSGIAIDNNGRIYVSDSLGRVLVYEQPSNRDASRIVGLTPPAQGQRPPPSEYTIGTPEGLFIAEGRLGVVDPQLNRILIFDPIGQWPAATEETPSPAATAVIGQSGFGSIDRNRGRGEPNESTLSNPIGAHYSNGELFVADSGNHRVLVFNSIATGAQATRVLGQPHFNVNAPNRVEGRELFLYGGGDVVQGLSDGAGLAIDNRSDPPRLYIADTYNNRILGYADARRVRPGDIADIVIGQNDLTRTAVNAPFNTPSSFDESGLFRPSGLAVDAQGNLWVADSGNSRVLRFASPFNNLVSEGQRYRANLVLGQLGVSQKITDPSPRNMAWPFGLAFTSDGSLIVSDALHNRLLFFRRPEAGDFTTGQPAERVVGQPDFFTVARGNTPTRMSSPRHLTVDTDDRLYVADAGNNRVLVYDRITVGGSDPTPAFILTAGLSRPQGVWVSPLTGEIWVANTGGNRATRFPRYERLAVDTKSDYEIPSGAPLALTQDPSGNLYVAEGVNRVAIFYNGLAFRIAGNYATRPLSPGSIGILAPAGEGAPFATTAVYFADTPNPVPLPKTLGDVQVLLNNQPVPLYYVSASQVNFLVPMNAPDSGTGEIQVIRASTGQVIAASIVQFDRVSPALFVADGSAEGQVAALNQDNSVNRPGNGARRGEIIQVFGTGQGRISNAPPDGTPPSGPLPIQEAPLQVVIGTQFLSNDDIQYSGLAPSLVGVWQLNLRIPQAVAPADAVPIVVVLRSVPSNQQVPGATRRLQTTIAVRQ